MLLFFSKKRARISFKLVAILVACLIGLSGLFGLSHQPASGNVSFLPAPGSFVNVSQSFHPTLLRGVTIHPENPFAFDFIVEGGDANLSANELNKETTKLIKYFLSALTIPQEDLWVNLSPYEKERIVPDELGITEMGKGLLSQDYVLKQLLASVTYPENPLGKKFWDKVYKKAYELYGTTNIPVNTFNKIWIVPEKAVIYEKDNSAVVVESKLKVMLEEDYFALNNNLSNSEIGIDRLKNEDVKKLNNISSSVMKEVVLPAIEEEVNHGENFSSLRQMYNSLLLALWFKNKLQANIINKVYADKRKVKGVEVSDKALKEKIYNQYLEAYKKGVYNYIKSEFDEKEKRNVSRRYYSGGMDFTSAPISFTTVTPNVSSPINGEVFEASVTLEVSDLEESMQQASKNEAYSSPISLPINIADYNSSDYLKEFKAKFIQQGMFDFPSWDIVTHDLGATGPMVAIDKKYHQIVINSKAWGKVSYTQIFYQTARAMVIIDTVEKTGFYVKEQKGWPVALQKYLQARAERKTIDGLFKMFDTGVEKVNKNIEVPVIDVPEISAPVVSEEDKANTISSLYGGLGGSTGGIYTAELAMLNFGDEIESAIERIKNHYFPASPQNGWYFLNYLRNSNHPFVRDFVSEVGDKYAQYPRSYFLRNKNTYSDISRLQAFKKQLDSKIAQFNRTGQPQVLRVGVVGAGYGQEPISAGIFFSETLSRMIAESGGDPNSIRVKIHVISYPDDIFGKITRNEIIFPESSVSNAFKQEEIDKYFQADTNGLGYKRSASLNTMVDFTGVDLLTANEQSFAGLEGSLDVLLIHNVFQYLRAKNVEKDEFTRQVDSMFVYLDSLLAAGGVLSIEADGSLDEVVSGRLKEELQKKYISSVDPLRNTGDLYDPITIKANSSVNKPAEQFLLLWGNDSPTVEEAVDGLRVLANSELEQTSYEVKTQLRGRLTLLRGHMSGYYSPFLPTVDGFLARISSIPPETSPQTIPSSVSLTTHGNFAKTSFNPSADLSSSPLIGGSQNPHNDFYDAASQYLYSKGYGYWDVGAYRAIEAMKQNPRADFVDSRFTSRAYDPTAVVMYEQCFLPSAGSAAHEAALLSLTGSENVLHIGTGSGWMVGIISSLLTKEGSSIRTYEINGGMIAHARTVLGSRSNITFVEENAFSPGAITGEFKRIVVEGSITGGIPSVLFDHLAPGGIMLAAVDYGDGKMPVYYRITKNNDSGIKSEVISEDKYFQPMSVPEGTAMFAPPASNEKSSSPVKLSGDMNNRFKEDNNQEAVTYVNENLGNLLTQLSSAKQQTAPSDKFKGSTIVHTLKGRIYTKEGVFTYAQQLLKQLAQRNSNLTQVIIYGDTVNTGTRQINIGDSKIVFVPYEDGNMQSMENALENLQQQPNLVITHSLGFQEGLVTAKYSRSHNLPFLPYAHFDAPSLNRPENSKSKEIFLETLGSRGQAVATLTEDSAQTVKELGFKPVVVGPLVDLNLFSQPPSPVNVFLARTVLGKAGQDDILLVSPNTYLVNKGPVELVKAVERIIYPNAVMRFFSRWAFAREIFHKAGFKERNIKVLFCGTFFSDDYLKESLENYAKARGLEGVFSFMGEIAHDFMPNVYAAADGVVLFSQHEGFGLVPIEAGLSGKPVIGSNIAGINQTVLNGQTGLLVDWSSDANVRVRDLSKAIDEFMAMPQEQRESMGKKANSRVRQHFDPNDFIPKHEDAYVEAMTGSQKQTTEQSSSPVSTKQSSFVYRMIDAVTGKSKRLERERTAQEQEAVRLANLKLQSEFTQFRGNFLAIPVQERYRAYIVTAVWLQALSRFQGVDTAQVTQDTKKIFDERYPGRFFFDLTQTAIRSGIEMDVKTALDFESFENGVERTHETFRRNGVVGFRTLATNEEVLGVAHVMFQEKISDPKLLESAVNVFELSPEGFKAMVEARVPLDKLMSIGQFYQNSPTLGDFALGKFKQGTDVDEVARTVRQALGELNNDNYQLSKAFPGESVTYVPARMASFSSKPLVQEAIARRLILPVRNLSVTAREILGLYGIDGNDANVYLIPMRYAPSSNIMHNRAISAKFTTNGRPNSFVFKGAGLADKFEFSRGDGVSVPFRKGEPPSAFRGGNLAAESVAYVGASGWLRNKFYEYYDSNDEVFTALKNEGLSREAADMFLQAGAQFVPLLLPVELSERKVEQKLWNGIAMGLPLQRGLSLVKAGEVLHAVGVADELIPEMEVLFYQIGIPDRIEELSLNPDFQRGRQRQWKKDTYRYSEFFKYQNLNAGSMADREKLLKEMVLRDLALLRILWNEGYAATTRYGTIVGQQNLNPLFSFDPDTISKASVRKQASDIFNLLSVLSMVAYAFDIWPDGQSVFSVMHIAGGGTEVYFERGIPEEINFAINKLHDMNPKAFEAFRRGQFQHSDIFGNAISPDTGEATNSEVELFQLDTDAVVSNLGQAPSSEGINADGIAIEKVNEKSGVNIGAPVTSKASAQNTFSSSPLTNNSALKQWQVESLVSKGSDGSSESDLNDGAQIMREVLQSFSDDEIVDILRRTNPDKSFTKDDFSRQVYIQFYSDKGTQKDVYRVAFSLQGGGSLEVLIALKSERTTGDIYDDEILYLKELQARGIRVPHFGGQFTLNSGRRGYLEEFIEGKTAEELLVSGQLTPAMRKSIVTLMMDAFLATGRAPRDIHPQNFIISSKDGKVVLVDVGAYTDNTANQVLAGMQRFYGFKAQEWKQGDNYFIYDATMEAYNQRNMHPEGIRVLENFWQDSDRYISAVKATNPRVAEQLTNIQDDLLRYLEGIYSNSSSPITLKDPTMDDLTYEGYRFVPKDNIDNEGMAFKSISVFKNEQNTGARVRFYVFDRIKTIVLEQFFPFPDLEESGEPVAGRGRALFRDLFLRPEYAGYRIVPDKPTPNLKKSMYRIPEISVVEQFNQEAVRKGPAPEINPQFAQAYKNARPEALANLKDNETRFVVSEWNRTSFYVQLPDAFKAATTQNELKSNNQVNTAAPGVNPKGSNQPDTSGGIDFSMKNVEIKTIGQGRYLLSSGAVFDVNNFEGFTFRIIKIEQVKDLNGALSLLQKNKDASTARQN